MRRYFQLTVYTVIVFTLWMFIVKPVMAAPKDDGVIRVGGSSTMLPFMSTVAYDFMNKYKTWDKVDKAFPNKKIVIYVAGGGSGFGVQSLAKGTIDAGLVSRELKDKEKNLLGAHQNILVGKDAVAFAVNRANPLAPKAAGFSREQLADIFSGRLKTYKDVDPSMPDSKIVLLVRDPGAGSAEIVQEIIMGEKQISRSALQLPSQGALLKKLETNKLTFAYISAGLLFGTKNLRGFSYQGVEPTADNILSGRYSLVRPLYIVVKEPRDALVKSFIDYVMTDGQRVVRDNHYIPVKDSPAKAKKRKK